MIICTECGEHNADDARFCANCNAFLEWEGAAEGRTAVRHSPVTTTPHPAEVRTTESVPAKPAVARPSEQIEQPPRPPVQPIGPARRPIAPGDVICGMCGEGNPPTRRFCRRCGTSLAEAEPVKLSWWQRFHNWLTRRRNRMYAASRVGHDERRNRRHRAGSAVRRTFRWIRNILGIVIVIAGIGYGIYPPLRHMVNNDILGIKDKTIGTLVDGFTPVHPNLVDSPGADPSHPGDLAVDNNTITYWAAPSPLKGGHAILTLHFNHPANLAKAIVYGGVGTDLQRTDRPKTLHVTYSTGETFDLHLSDTVEQQRVTLDNGIGATSMRIEVTEAYPSLNGGEVAISEIELFEQNR